MITKTEPASDAWFFADGYELWPEDAPGALFHYLNDNLWAGLIDLADGSVFWCRDVDACSLSI